MSDTLILRNGRPFSVLKKHTVVHDGRRRGDAWRLTEDVQLDEYGEADLVPGENCEIRTAQPRR